MYTLSFAAAPSSVSSLPLHPRVYSVAFSCLFFSKKLYAESSENQGVREVSIGYAISIFPRLKWKFSCFILSSINYLSDMNQEIAGELGFLLVWEFDFHWIIRSILYSLIGICRCEDVESFTWLARCTVLFFGKILVGYFGISCTFLFYGVL